MEPSKAAISFMEEWSRLLERSMAGVNQGHFNQAKGSVQNFKWKQASFHAFPPGYVSRHRLEIDG